MLIGILALLGC